jgi:UDP-N-acetyl-2-amino-2-deoxyglucuronate dehydrogenase
MHTIAIAGIGNAAEMHAAAVGDIPNATVVAGSCRTESKGRAFAETFDCEWFPGTEGMLEATEPDVLSVCTPSGSHLEPALAAAERGVSVLCEKPLEITTARVDRMVDAADANDVLLGGIFQQRYNPVVRTVRSAVSDGRFGDLSAVNAYVPWWRDDEYYEGSWKGTQELDGGGALMNQSIHGVDVAQWLAASAGTAADANPVEEVFAYTDERGHDPSLIEVEDTAVAVLRYRDGTLGQVLGATSMYPGSLKRIQVAGRDGTAEILEDDLVTWSFRDERPEDEAVRERFRDGTESGGAADPMSIDSDNHRRNIADFLESLESGSGYPLDGREARKAVAVIESVYESAEAGEPVQVGDRNGT